MEEYLAVCIVCFEQFLPGSSQENRFNGKTLLKFCHQLQSLQPIKVSPEKSLSKASGTRGRRQDGKSATQLFQRLLEELKNRDNLALCRNCQSFVTAAVKSNEEMIETELRVRHLQLQILKEMQQLEGQVEEYYMEMRKLGNFIVANPDPSCLELISDERTPGSSRNSGRLQDDVVAFRAHIMTVMDDLKQYRVNTRARLHVKLAPPHDQQKRKQPRPEVERVTEEPDLPVVTSILMDIDDEEFQFKHELSDEAELEKDLKLSANETILSDEDLEEQDHDDDRGSDVDYVPEKRERADNHVHETNANESIGDNVNPGTSMASGPAVDMHGVKFLMEDLTLFRRRMVTRVLQKLEVYQKELDNPDDASPNDNFGVRDPRGRYLFQYDHVKGSLFSGNIEVTINDKANSITCSKCRHEEKVEQDLRLPHLRKPEQTMQTHVFSKHLFREVFKCSTCSSVFRGFKKYKEHMQGHKKKFVCDVCGKPLLALATLRDHKWLHLNAAEKAEAERQGFVLHRKKQKEREVRGEFPCSTCGKVCATKALVKQHEVVHSKNREKIVCPQCGKSVFKRCWLRHQRDMCPPKDVVASGKGRKDFFCSICSKTFPSRGQFACHKKTHLRQGKKKDFPCPICAMPFKSNREQAKHKQKVHPHPSTVSKRRDWTMFGVTPETTQADEGLL